MSDYYGLPISIPPGVTAPNLQSLYAALGQSGGVGGGGGGILSSLGGSLGGIPGSLSSFQGPKFLGGTGELGLGATAFRAAPYALAGQLGAAGINSVLPSTGGAGNVREVLADAAVGAGLGGAVGSVVPVLGTGVGALAGGALGGAYGLAQDLFGGGEAKPPDYKQSLADAASQSGLNPNDYTTAYDLLSKAGGDSKQVAGALAQQLLSDAAQKKQVDAYNQQQAQQRSSDQQFALAIQSQAAKFFTPYVNNIITAGKAQSDLLRGQADSMPPQYKQLFLNQAEQALNSSQQIAGAYAAQSSMLPSQYMYSMDLKRQQQLAQLQYQQSVVNAQQGGGGGSAGFNQLVQQLQGQTGGG